MKIVNFGSCNIDIVYKVDHIVAAGETEESEDREVFAGGKGLNQSIAAARAGSSVYHAGLIGEDGAFLLEMMKKSGVDCSFVRRVKGPSGHAVIQVDGRGENAIFIHKGANARFTEEYVREVLSHFSQEDFVILQNEINLNPCIIDEAYKKGMFTVLNPSPFNEEILKLDFNKISCIVVNRLEGQALSGKEEPAKILSELRARFPHLKILLTLGEKGCLYADDTGVTSHPAYEVTTVDSTAAGDTFTGYFIASLALGLPTEEQLKRASCAAALSVSVKGAAPSIPKAEEVLEAVKRLRYKDTGEKDRTREFIGKVNSYFEEHLSEATLSKLSETLGYSSAYTGQLLRQKTGKSFSMLLDEARFRRAEMLLRETDLPISQIIKDVGCTNESYFRKKFRIFSGYTPLGFRKAANAKKA